MALVFQFCSSTKNAAKKQSAKITYTANVQPLMLAQCTPCHFPPKGNKKPLDNYMALKVNIDEIISRIQREPTHRGFMPFKKPKLSDSLINVYVQWKTDGLLEN